MYRSPEVFGLEATSVSDVIVKEVALDAHVQAAAAEVLEQSTETVESRSVATEMTERLSIGGDENRIATLYLNILGKIPQLDGPGEIALAKRMEAGVLAGERLEIASKDEESLEAACREEFEMLADDGAAAKEQMITANLQLVASLAKRRRRSGMAFLDLVQEGTFGLVRAIEKFDFKKGFRFSSLAVPEILKAMDTAIENQARVVRVPRYRKLLWDSVKSISRDLEAENHVATPGKIAAELDMTERELADVINDFQPADSLDREVTWGRDDTERTPIGESLADPAVPDMVTVVTQTSKPQLAGIEGFFDERELLFVSLVSGRAQMSEAEMGRVLSLNARQVRHIHDRVFAMLQHPSANLASRLDAKAGSPVTEAWRDEASCQDEGPSAFFPRKGKGAMTALCQDCPVAKLCLTYAVDQGIIEGYWGGLSARKIDLERRTAEKAGQEYALPEVGQPKPTSA